MPSLVCHREAAGREEKPENGTCRCQLTNPPNTSINQLVAAIAKTKWRPGRRYDGSYGRSRRACRRIRSLETPLPHDVHAGRERECPSQCRLPCPVGDHRTHTAAALLGRQVATVECCVADEGER
nr:hypothetical protein Itr_chr10CG15050 [Ipomoea trifida]